MVFKNLNATEQMRYLSQKVFCSRLYHRIEALWRNNRHKYPQDFNEAMMECFNPDNLPEPYGWGSPESYGWECSKVSNIIKNL